MLGEERAGGADRGAEVLIRGELTRDPGDVVRDDPDALAPRWAGEGDMAGEVRTGSL